jgi:hypothetical protein
VVALSEALGIKWSKSHPVQAKIAAQLATAGKLSKDVSQLMAELNALRKDGSYGESGTDLLNRDLETLVLDLESMIDEADEIISRREGQAAESHED